MTKLGAFAIIFDATGHILLGHRRDMDLWNLPGGGLEPGELPDAGVIREVLEETGLVVRAEKLLGIYSKAGKDELIFLFRCVIAGGELQKQTPETDDNRFFPPDALPDRLIPRHRERIADALTGAPQLICRQQSGPDTQSFLQMLEAMPK
jgi:ADP-ribose pyrophosphatase YjhB (NUDIX family)